MKLINEITAEIKAAMEAEGNAKAWKEIERSCMNNARKLIATAKQIDPEAANVDPKTLIDQIKAELTPAEETPEISPESPDVTETADRPE